MSTPLVIDCDPGVDDFIAIQIALRSPELNVLALTTTGGNVQLRYTTRNALRALEATGRADIPVARGSARALRGPFRYADYFHGPTGLTVRMPMPKTPPVATPAVDFLAKLLVDAPEPVVIAAIGPLTNIAHLLHAHPGVATRIERLIVMGGAVDVPGNVTPYAEFNVWADPEAAQAVLASSLRVTLIGLDVCREVYLTRRDFKDGGGTVGRMIRAWFAAHPDRTRFELCDPLAIAAIVEPGLIETESVALDVDTSWGTERGRTLRASHGATVDVALRVEAAKAKQLMVGRATSL